MTFSLINPFLQKNPFGLEQEDDGDDDDDAEQDYLSYSLSSLGEENICNVSIS